MKVSIITVSYNSERTIEDTLNSILSQTYKNIEYIIIDGKSDDNTIGIIKTYYNKFNGRLKWISEPDMGLYHAMNKGIKLAKGDIIGILNSDDLYLDNFVISDIVKMFENSNFDILYSDLLFVDSKDIYNIKRVWKAGKGRFRFGWNPPHPSVFLKKYVYDEIGLFDTKYKIASDYDLLYRVFCTSSYRFGYLERYTVRMRLGGKSTSKFKNIIRGNYEIYNSLVKNGEKLSLLIVFFRLFRKAFQIAPKISFLVNIKQGSEQN